MTVPGEASPREKAGEELERKDVGWLRLARLAQRNEGRHRCQLTEMLGIAAGALDQCTIEQDHRWTHGVERARRWERKHASHLDVVLSTPEGCGGDRLAGGGDEKWLHATG